MTVVLFIYLMTVAAVFILKDKFNLDEILMASRYKLFYKLGRCAFCFFFWTAAICTLVWYLVPDVWLVPLAVVGIFVEISDFKVKEDE